MQMNFCRRCGSSLIHKQGLSFRCKNSHVIFANASPCARALVATADNRFVMQIRGMEPYKNSLDTFGGFVEENESLENAAMRELFEEAGIMAIDCDEPRFISSDTAPYPYGGEILTSHISTFFVRLHEGVIPKPRDGVKSIKLIPVNEIDVEQLTTPEIRRATQKVIQMIKDGEL